MELAQPRHQTVEAAPSARPFHTRSASSRVVEFLIRFTRESHHDQCSPWSALGGEETIVRTVLVCVRTPRAAQGVMAVAARRGLAAVVRTAVSDPEVMRRLAERPADVILADTALARPDSVGFTRRVLARSPGSTLLLFGAEEPGTAAAVVAAGARGLLNDPEHDVVGLVARAVLLLGAAGRGGREPAEPTGGPVAGVEAGAETLPAVVPVQRADGVPGEEPCATETRVVTAAEPQPRRNAAVESRFSGVRRGGNHGRPLLTEREMQVLIGMADGKSNAEIGRELFVSEDTVKTHARRLFRKLGARDRAHAVAAGFRAGLVV
jgi:DNA-binding NarL/FixJ family response regulator